MTDEQGQPQPQAVLDAAPAVMTASVQIIRAGTGKVENFDLTFTPIPDEPPKEGK